MTTDRHPPGISREAHLAGLPLPDDHRATSKLEVRT